MTVTQFLKILLIVNQSTKKPQTLKMKIAFVVALCFAAALAAPQKGKTEDVQLLKNDFANELNGYSFG